MIHKRQRRFRRRPNDRHYSPHGNPKIARNHSFTNGHVRNKFRNNKLEKEVPDIKGEIELTDHDENKFVGQTVHTQKFDNVKGDLNLNTGSHNVNLSEEFIPNKNADMIIHTGSHTIDLLEETKSLN